MTMTISSIVIVQNRANTEEVIIGIQPPILPRTATRQSPFPSCSTFITQAKSYTGTPAQVRDASSSFPSQNHGGQEKWLPSSSH
jgi:hypothetical protein